MYIFLHKQSIQVSTISLYIYMISDKRKIHNFYTENGSVDFESINFK